MKEPLVHFLLLGAGLFLLHAWQNGPAPLAGGASGTVSPEVVVTQSEIRQIVDVFAKTRQRPPTEEETRGLIESYVRDEITYREALAAGLDREDSVIRRRLRLKMEFLFEDIAAQTEPTEEELQAFMERNPEAYRFEPRIGFRQVYVNPDRRGARAESEARAILDRLNAGSGPEEVGDPFLLGLHFPPTVITDIEGQFGPGFAAALLDLKPGQWEGPLRSGFGWHLVRVEARTEGRMPALDEIREIVKRDWALVRQQELKDAAYARLRERYRVVVAPVPAKVAPATVAESRKAVQP